MTLLLPAKLPVGAHLYDAVTFADVREERGETNPPPAAKLIVWGAEVVIVIFKEHRKVVGDGIFEAAARRPAAASVARRCECRGISNSML
jgi:hypothetical protein